MSKLAAVMGAAIVAAGVLISAPASAQFAKPEDAVKYRKAAFTVMAAHMGRVAGVARGAVPFNAADVQNNAAIIETMSKLPFDAFGAGTDKGDTRALPAIWSNPDKFKSAADNLQRATSALSTAAKGGNLDQVKAAFGEVGKACKACHDDFRKE